MIFSKKIQYALMLVFQLDREGRTTIQDVAKEFGIPEQFLQQIAVKLRKAKVVKSFRGPGGGYELIGEPRLSDIFLALGKSSVISKSDFRTNFDSLNPVKSLVALSASKLDQAFDSYLNTQISSIFI